MGIEQFELNMLSTPMVQEANIYDLSLGKILADKVLKDYLLKLIKFSPPTSLINQHANWLLEQFSELKTADKIPMPWVWADLVTAVENVGSLEQAQEKCKQWLSEGEQVAYWTGGLELTEAHFEVANFLVNNQGMKIILGIEPATYPEENSKGRGSLTDTIVPISLWSKLLENNGFIFEVPRPMINNREIFYQNLYQLVTAGEASIVVSEKDPYKETKKQRGKVVLVPEFNRPATTDLYQSFFST
jgi:hypothetical protein